MGVIDNYFENIDAGDLDTIITSPLTDAVESTSEAASSKGASVKTWIKDTAYDVVNRAAVIGKKIKSFVNDSAKYVMESWKSNNASISQENSSEKTSNISLVNSLYNIADTIGETASDTLNYFGDILESKGFSSSTFGKVLVSALKQGASARTDYKDGISETSFGEAMASSWAGNASTSFLDYFKSNNSGGGYKINIMKSTPLDANESRSAMFGTMILGTPYTFNSVADPDNRVFINSLVRDCKIVSFTPGLPKYNGSEYTQSDANNILKQTANPNDMLTYLLRNGMDKTFSEKDKRYYTFEAKYEEYFSYLEAMLNPIWIKMGLANGADGRTFNIFSFFNIRKGEQDGGIDPSNYKTLIEKYNGSIGFYTNPAGAFSESVSSSPTGFGSELSSRVNSESDTYQKLNYISGMGGGGSLRNTGRKVGIGMQIASNIGNQFAESFGGTISIRKEKAEGLGKIVKLAKVAAQAAIDTARVSATDDFGSFIQSFSVSNGMRVVYPELWSDSIYSKSINLNFSFVSPYGDPLSIFRYVYVPFCALLCLGLPRQASSNGYISPFFVRADIPGRFTTDLSFISDITWTKGGAQNLWSKDGLPRAIDVTVSLADLYPYLSMTKRLSFLSSNPSYTVFLDNMAGLCALNDTNSEDELNDYFKRLVDRVSGAGDYGNVLWNKFSSSRKSAAYSVGNSARTSISKNVSNIPWFHNSSL